MQEIKLIESIKRIRAIADIGLLYAPTDFDLDRYTELRQLSTSMLADLISQPLQRVENFYLPVTEYPTVKVDVRGMVLNADKKILLVQEQSDGGWSLPGGWADIGFSPSEVVKKEVWEESGLEVTPKRLMAVFDKKCHPHPPQPYYLYKLIIYCDMKKEDTLHKGFDILNADFFDIDKLPELSQNRILESQIKIVYGRLLAGEQEALFD